MKVLAGLVFFMGFAVAEPDDNALGLAAEKQGRLSEAIEYFTRAITARPNDPNLYYNRGMARQAQGDKADSNRDFIKAQALDPNDEQGYGHLGSDLASDQDAQIIQYSQEIDSNPQAVDLIGERAWLKQNSGNITGAITDYRRVCELAPDAETFVTIGALEVSLNDWEAAMRDWRKATAFPGEDASYAYLWIWFAEMEIGRRKGSSLGVTESLANTELLKAIKAHGREGSWINTLANYLTGNIGDNDLLDAANGEPRLDVKDEKLWEITYFQGMKDLLKGQTQAAIEELRACRDTGPESQIEYSLAVAQLKLLGIQDQKR